jgi:transposase
MREICMSGLMSGEGKRSVAAWPKPPRPSSTLLKAQKNDDLDAEAIAEAASRPTMRFVEVKSQAQSDIQALHRARERLVSERTASGGDNRNRLRAASDQHDTGFLSGLGQ